MWMSLFLIGTFWFWALLAAEALWLVRCLYEESGFGIGGSLIALSLVLLVFGDFNVFAWIWLNPIFLLECAAGYFVAGAMWSIGRFKLLCTDARDLLEDAKQEFKEKEQIPADESIPARLREDWRKFAESKEWPGASVGGRYQNRISTIEDVIPKPRNNKATIMYWMGYWPLSILWFVLHDMIERIVRRIYRYFSEIFASIARNTFVGVKDEFEDDA